MSHTDSSNDATTSPMAKAVADGLPAISPDVVEQEQGGDMDDIVPGKGYDMLPRVGLGGSAGSIPALQRFFSAMPAQSGMAFVVVLHLAPEHTSIMDEILGRTTTMRVVEAQDGQTVEADHVYVIPPGKIISAEGGRLKLTPLEPEKGRRITVDLFFRTLADTHGPSAVAIVLSGADGDGALGIKRIKERGGLTVAQDPGEAEHPSMPNHAIETGMVDWILPVEQMPARLVQFRETGKRLKLPPEDGPELEIEEPKASAADEAALRDVLIYLRTRTARDFSYYKRATVLRRIARRMQVNNVPSLPEYLLFLRTHPGEAVALQDDLLISVTNFFRDRACFDALELNIPALFAEKKSGDVVRVWTAGCATGEEAYSLAMMLLEYAEKLEAAPAIQVFATDLADEAIARAREGIFPPTITADVSERRLRRFFQRDPNGFRARSELRECVLFAVHDLLKDAPFSRLDLFTCRNLLIYLTSEAQRRVFDIAHFALKPEGWLFIGTSETADEEGLRWRAVDKKHRIYRQRPAPRVGVPVPIGPSSLERTVQVQERKKNAPYLHGPAFVQASERANGPGAGSPVGRSPSWEELHFKLIERFAPPSLIVTRDHEIVHVSENAGRFLHFRGGQPSVNLLQAVHPMLRIELRAALFRAAQTSTPVEVFRVPVEMDGKTLAVDIRISPAQEIAPDYLLVVFAVRETTDSEAVEARQEAEPVARHLERELEQMKTRLRNTIEQYEAGNEELKAGNEELQAMNEELRSSAEELETSREELQSVNEELTTVNEQLKGKVDELAHSNADLANLMAATGVATIFLDRELCITRYTPSAVAIFSVLPGDLGRPLSDLTYGINYPDMKADAERVLATLVPIKREVTDGQRWFLAQLLPYRAAGDRIAGVVLSFVDITETRAARHALRESEARLQLAVEATRLAVFDWDLRTDRVEVNEQFREMFGLRPDQEVVGAEILGQRIHPDDQVSVRAVLDRAFHHDGGGRYEVEFRVVHPDGTQRWLFSYGQVHFKGEGAGRRALRVSGTDLDFTARRHAEVALRESELRLRTLADAVPQIIWSNDAAGVANYFNQRWYEFTGLSFEESVVAGWQAVVHPDDAAASKERWQQAQMAGEVFDTEYRLRGADGSYRWFIGRNVPVVTAAGIITGWFGTATDIQELKEAGTALRTSQERLRLILENAREYAIFSLDLDRQILSWNSGAQAILGYTAEEAIGRKGDLIFTPEDCADCAPEKEAQTALAEGRAADERWHLRKDGSRFWASGVMMAMRDESGEAIGLVKIFRDQTAELRDKEALEQSRAEVWEALQENERARETAEAAVRAKDHFLAVLSHELRTPLTPVLMAVQTLARRKDLPEAVREALEMIRRNVQIEAQFIDDMLDVTKIERGKLELVCEPIDLHQAVRYAVEIVEPDIREKGQRLTVSLEATRPELVGDLTRLQQALWNLLKNASKFTPEGGPIRVTSRNGPDCICVEVSDGGIGFEPGAEERIFNPFVQADPSVTQKFGGLGLGLAISKATVDGHGGRLIASSEGPGRGATFVVELPVGSSTPKS